jgi:molecular chaperone GrpE (heat shock protein)
MGELWQKKALVAGFEKTFEIGRQFRNEGMDAEHLQDYTQMEFYWGYANYEDGMKLVEAKIQKFLESLDVKSFGEIGDEMDAEIHDAMMTQTDESMDDHVILSVFEKGYTYRDKVIRHAKVIVNKK